MKGLISDYLRRWAAQRSPSGPKVVLAHKSIYVPPTRQGLILVLVASLLWLLGTNYQNNVILASAFLLLSLLIVSVIDAYRNLSGLTLSITRSHPAFAGDWVELDLLVEPASKTEHESLRLGWSEDFTEELDLLGGQAQTLRLAHKARRRGWLYPERLKVESYYPLGFIHAWSWCQPEARALIYPQPRPCRQAPVVQLSRSDGQELAGDNHEEFQGFKAYRPGMPMTHLAWKQYAREQGLYLKDYTGYQSEQVWLDWEALPGLDTESRLSRLCYWALEYGKTTTEYGLRLPGQTLPIGRGPDHQARVLRSLALYGLTDTEGSAHG